MKKLIVIFFAMFSLNVFAQPQFAASKMLICMEAAYASAQAYEMKVNKKRLTYPKVDDVIFAAIVKVAMDKGYRAKTYKDAVQIGHDSCVMSKLWNEMSETVEE